MRQLLFCSILLPAFAMAAQVPDFSLNPIPPSLEKRRGQHPRIYLDTERVAALRQAVKTTHAPLWEKLRPVADRLVKSGPPEYREKDTSSGDEQLWQREVGNAMPTLAMAYVITGDQKYLDSARKWAVASCGYKTWGLGRIDGMDLAAGHQLFGLAIVYDWCWRDLGDEARQTIRQTLVKRTGAMFEAAATEKAWWRRSYMQNHLWVNITGMSAAGFALFDEEKEAHRWIALPLDKFRRTMDALGPDGASHEGVGYWEYGVEYMLKFMWLARDLLGVDLYDRAWWKNTSNYGLYLTLPRKSWMRDNCVVDIGDCPRGHWYGPEYLLRALAHEYRNPQAQWLAGEEESADVVAKGAPWLNLLWFDPAIAPEPPTDLPTMRHFEDMDIVAARSDWSGDESLLIFKCGPFIGHKGVADFAYDPGGGHVHPDANHLLLFGNGEWLVRDDGYRPKWSAQHNTLLIDGKGQVGEGKMWLDGGAILAAKASPRIVRAASTRPVDHIVGDATSAYPRASGLTRFMRHAIFLKPNVLIVADDIALERAADLELRLHPEAQQTKRDGEAFMMEGKRAVLRIECLTGEGVKQSAEAVAAEDRHGGKTDTMFTIRMMAHQARWRNTVALSWSAKGEAPARVTMKADGETWTFSAGKQMVRLDWVKGILDL